MLRKYEVINTLARRFRFTRFLEISTPTTGLTYREALENPDFELCDRLVYNCPETHTDGLPIDFRTASDVSYEVTRTMFTAGGELPLYDIIFVDPFHTYRCTNTDLTGAWLLLRPGGMMVVHDCNPPGPELCSPEYVRGAWCGLTFQAYVDFILSGVAMNVFTVDSDFGVGIVHKPIGTVTREPPRDLLLHDWSIARDDAHLRYACFDKHRSELLNLITEEQFMTYFALPETAVS